MLYERIPMQVLRKSETYFLATSLVKPSSPAEKSLLEAALVALGPAESLPPSAADQQRRQLFLIHLLRRLARFDEARVQLEAWTAMKPELPKNLAESLRIEIDLIELKIDSHWPWTIVPDGKIHAKPIVTKAPAFGLPLNQSATILSQSSEVKYPLAMRYAGINAEVVVAVAVNPQGRVTKAHVLRASQADFFPDAALAFARDCRFAPSQTDFGPAAFECAVAIEFSLPEN